MSTTYFTSESFIKCLSLFVSITLPFCFSVTHSFQIKKILSYLFCVCMWVCVWGWVWATLLKDSLEKLAFPFRCVCPGDWTPAIRFGGRRLYPLSHLAAPGYFGKWVWIGTDRTSKNHKTKVLMLRFREICRKRLGGTWLCWCICGKYLVVLLTLHS